MRTKKGTNGERVNRAAAAPDVVQGRKQEPVTITFELVREEEYGWQIDHIRGQFGSVDWCSNELVAAVQPANRAN